jgi:trimethylamine---corrinoid protein Co-methyltransferase
LHRKEIVLKDVNRRGLPGGLYKPLTEPGIRLIHENAMRIIEEVGFKVYSPSAFDYFAEYGAQVDKDECLVRISREKAEELINKAPSEIRLCGQDSKHDVLLGGTRVYSGTGGTALYIYRHETKERRLATLDDLKRIARLVDHLDNIHVYLLPTYPNDLPSEIVDVNRFFAGLDNTRKHVMGGLYTSEGLLQVVRMAEVVAGSADRLRERPIVSMITCIVSPLKIDERYGDFTVILAQRGIPVVCPAEPLCGATSPVTLAGNVLTQTVDSLLGVMLTQIVNPGTPVIMGSVATSTDLRNLSYLAGSVEMGLINAAGAQMAQFYKIPFYSTGGMTDSKVLDVQAGYESAITNLMSALAGANFIHDSAGLMEFALSVCEEKYVVDNEILGMVMRAVQGIEVNEETLAYDLIKSVGPGGNFVSARHTRRHMRQEHYSPTLSNRDTREEWEARGSKVTWERAAERVKEILAGEHYSLPAEVRSKIMSETSGIVV